MMPKVSRYHPLLVVLHWLLALMIIVSLTRGFFVLARIPNVDPHKIDALRLHMTVGIVMLALMTLRFLVRLNTSRPAVPTSGFASRDRIAVLAPYGLYFLFVAMAGTGLATAILAGLPAILYGHSGAPLPDSFLVFPTRVAHGVIGYALVVFIATHVLAVLVHQFVRKDGILRHMWFGRRTVPGG